jgi:DNA gyrase/topoisomerase IV subunit B
MIVENFLELVDIDDIIIQEEYINMVDISVDVDQSFLLSNGLISHNSASSAFRKYRNSELQGAYSLRGKFVNAMETTIQKLSTTEMVVGLMGSLGLKLGQKVVPGTLRYGRVILYTDADFDGNAISALLINFFYKYWPELFDNPIIFKAETPIVVVTSTKKKNHKISFYTQNEYNEWLSGQNPKDWDIEYKKGLAALVDDEYREIISNPKMTQITSDEISKDCLQTWFGKDSDLRKGELLK